MSKIADRFNIPVLNDQFLFFTWNDIFSKQYNCFIENKNDLSFTPHPSFSNNFETPLYQNTRYNLGTTTEGKEIELNLCFYNITLNEFDNAISSWLKIGTSALFLYDYEPNYGYNCKIKSVGNAKKIILGTDNDGSYLYLIETSVAFETMEDAYALSKYFSIFKRKITYSKKDNVTFPPDWNNVGANIFSSGSPIIASYFTVESLNDMSFLNNSGSNAEIQENNLYVNGTTNCQSFFFPYLTKTIDSKGISTYSYFSDNSFIWHSYLINNDGTLNSPFEISFDGLPNGCECLGFLMSSPISITTTTAISFPYEKIKFSDSFMWFKANSGTDWHGLTIKYLSNLGLLTIGDLPANMTILNSTTPLAYNSCKANQCFPAGKSYLYILINPHKETFVASDIKINISFRRRKAVI